MLLLALACVTTDSTPTETPAAESPLVWEVHEVACEADRYTVPAPRVGLASYVVIEHVDGGVRAKLEQVPEIPGASDWTLECSPDGYLLVVTYAYVAE